VVGGVLYADGVGTGDAGTYEGMYKNKCEHDRRRIEVRKPIKRIYQITARSSGSRQSGAPFLIPKAS
jgi:hypothetical protein